MRLSLIGIGVGPRPFVQRFAMRLNRATLRTPTFAYLCTHGGKPLDFRNFATASFKPLLKKAGLPDIRFYDLRHTCATLLLSLAGIILSSCKNCWVTPP